ncbi:clarin-3 [Chelmon rostratus]|uniref:clarin-3 n=1 Tax=Chelmon rostratus TaxID=109905 RepID=UPI001BE6978E|nr:clarin-3 [Chelmon rostratus]
MPSTKKTIYFMSSALVTSISVGLMGYAMSAEWAKMTMNCANTQDGNYNGSAVITLRLFNGNLNRNFCPVFGSTDLDSFPVVSTLTDTGATTSMVLHILVLLLVVLCLLFSAATILSSLYNSVSNPYETYMGPVGIYIYSSLSTCLSAVVLIIFVANVNASNMAERVVIGLTDSEVFLKKKNTKMLVGYYLIIPYAVLSLLAIALVYMYEHAAYTHRREQQKPTEDAPKEIMMY